MRLAFIEKFFTNHEIRTSMRTRYLRFKGMSYESKRYLCDINCVQLRKALAWFWCGNTQLEAVLGAWKGVPYAKRLCRGCNLRKVEDEEHLLFICPNTQKVRERFCLTLPLTHTSTHDTHTNQQFDQFVMAPPFIVGSNQCWEIIRNWVRNILVFKLIFTLNTLVIIRSIYGLKIGVKP
jgi:hypothetical protein